MMQTALEGREARAELGSGWRVARSLPPHTPDPPAFLDPLWQALPGPSSAQTLPELADRPAGLQGGACPLGKATAWGTGEARSVHRFALQSD